jgi:hypothetical protein
MATPNRDHAYVKLLVDALEVINDTTTTINDLRNNPMPSYILRTIPPELWARFKARSEQDGIPMRALMLLLIEAYADREINLQAERTDR